eukprot:TRINITY_DN6857_c0_g1_i2.p1 TRINITY_DN6857_c0_g1~~TRINITY_DN6857_c0_g1_i2.p1  ORF type:complete len:177 (+),score=50.31 TRINITY_DN6857_c0_g1_i2:22-531(+)
MQLFFFVHGLGGSEGDWENVMNDFTEKFQEEIKAGQLRLHGVQCNGGMMMTHDGVEAGGTRVAEEIEQIVKEELERDGQTQVEVSIVGHSLGGIYSRFALGHLDSHGFWDNERLGLGLFVTFASPHLGVRRPRDNSLRGWWYVAEKVKGRAKSEKDDQISPKSPNRMES